MNEALPVDAVALRDEVRVKYRDVAVNPRGTFHFHTGRALARRLGYDENIVFQMPESAIEAFAGVGNPFSQGALNAGERVVDLGSGGRFRLLYRRRTGWPRGTRRRRRYDRRDAATFPKGGDGDGPRQCRVPQGDHRGLAG